MQISLLTLCGCGGTEDTLDLDSSAFGVEVQILSPALKYKRKGQTMNTLEEVKKYCIDVIAHSNMDKEYTTTLGNGINACEAGEFAWSILIDIFDLTDEDIQPLVHKRVYELEEYYYGERRGYW